MQEGQETGCEILDPRSLTWEQRYALKRRAVAWAQDERSRVVARLIRRLGAWLSRAAIGDAAAVRRRIGPLPHQAC